MTIESLTIERLVKEVQGLRRDLYHISILLSYWLSNPSLNITLEEIKDSFYETKPIEEKFNEVFK